MTARLGAGIGARGGLRRISMTRMLQEQLTPEKAFIFRITHRSNVPWILENGLHCSRSTLQDPEFEGIGNPDLIIRRESRNVPIPPGDTLADYIPFYFTPLTPMLYNVTTGYGGIKRRAADEIVILVSSLIDLENHGVRYVFTDRHAYLLNADFFTDRSDLNQIDYDLLQRRDFRRDPEDPGKIERYQAEALAHRHVPVNALRGVACYTEAVKQEIEVATDEHDVELTTIVRRGWYFR